MSQIRDAIRYHIPANTACQYIKFIAGRQLDKPQISITQKAVVYDENDLWQDRQGKDGYTIEYGLGPGARQMLHQERINSQIFFTFRLPRNEYYTHIRVRENCVTLMFTPPENV